MKNTLCNLLGLSNKLRLPAGWLKTQARNKTIPCLFIGKKMQFNLEAVKEALADLAAKGGGND